MPGMRRGNALDKNGKRAIDAGRRKADPGNDSARGRGRFRRRFGFRFPFFDMSRRRTIPPKIRGSTLLDYAEFDAADYGVALADVWELFRDALADGLRIDPATSICDWADRIRILPRTSSTEPGRYRSARVPYGREIMEALSNHSGIEEVVCMKATQLGLTEIGNNWAGYVVDVAPGPMLMVFPTVDLAEAHSEQKLQPSIDATPNLAGKIGRKKSRDSKNTKSIKAFPGGIIMLGGSNTGATFRSKSIRYLFLDDIDGFALDIPGEGDPVTLARNRTDAFGRRRKIFYVSTPTIAGESRIESLFEASDQRRYHVPCPHCGAMQSLEWGGVGEKFGLKFDRDESGEVTRAYYKCISCKAEIDEAEKTGMLAAGEWIPTFPGRARRGYHINSLYSPIGWVSWRQIAAEFLEAKSDAKRLRAWTNTRLGLPYASQGQQPEWTALREREEAFEMGIVPAEALMLTGAADVQEDRIDVAVYAWGKQEQAFLIFWAQLWGAPANDLSVWQQLDEVFLRSFPVENGGGSMGLIGAALDTGGHATQEAYLYARRRAPAVMAVKGASKPNRPIISRPSRVDINYKGDVIKNGVQLWLIGTDTAKATIYQRLKSEHFAAGGGYPPGYFHFPSGLPDEFYLQLTAERGEKRYVNGHAKTVWKKLRTRNEVLDLTVYAYAAALRAGLAVVAWKSDAKPAGASTAPATPRPAPALASPSRERVSPVERIRARMLRRPDFSRRR